MLKLIAGWTIGASIVCLGLVPGASAGVITGNYTYSLSGGQSDASCLAYTGSNGWRDDFSSTGGGNSISSAPVTFSICDHITGQLAGGLFLISDGSGDTFAGTFSGVLVGLSAGGGDIFDGTFVETSSTGTYSSLTGVRGNLQDVTGQVNTPAFASGTFDFQSTPEPVPTALGGSGLVLLGLSRKLLKRRA